jgi:hypothetical protein
MARSWREIRPRQEEAISELMIMEKADRDVKVRAYAARAVEKLGRIG